MLLCFSATWFRDIKFRSKLSNLIVIMELIIIKLFCKKTINAPYRGMERRNDVTKERIVKELSKVRKQLADLQERQKDLESQLQMAEDAEKMKFIEKNKITLEHLILLNKVSEEEILSLLRKKEQEEQQTQQTEREAASHEQKNEVTL